MWCPFVTTWELWIYCTVLELQREKNKTRRDDRQTLKRSQVRAGVWRRAGDIRWKSKDSVVAFSLRWCCSSTSMLIDYCDTTLTVATRGIQRTMRSMRVDSFWGRVEYWTDVAGRQPFVWEGKWEAGRGRKRKCVCSVWSAANWVLRIDVWVTLKSCQYLVLSLLHQGWKMKTEENISCWTELIY